MNLLRRLLQLLDSTRIRLSRRSLSASDLHCGDWLQVADAAWCIHGRVRTPEREGFLLSPRMRQGSPGRLFPPRHEGPWLLELRNESFDIDAEDILVFPSGSQQGAAHLA